MGKMFKTITETWNPFTGCKWDCSYCWARRLVEGKFKTNYPNGFKPTFHPKRVNWKFKPGAFVFVSSMGDISFCPDDQLQMILDVIPKNPDVKFLLQTKNPGVFSKILTRANTYFGCTIETNRPSTQLFSKAPEPILRYAIMAALESDFDRPVHKFLSIEPVMDFDLEIFSTWIYDIDPEIVEIGADNYRHNLPEPSWDKVSKLIEILTLHGVKVIQKDGLERLRK